MKKPSLVSLKVLILAIAGIQAFISCSSVDTPELPPLENSSSSLGGEGSNSSFSSSSSGGMQYAYCIFSEDGMCLNGPLSACPQGGTLSNACPYNSSSSSSGGGSLSPSSSSSSAVSSTRCKDENSRDYFCEWGTAGYPSDNPGCYAIDPPYSDPPGRACTTLITECRNWGYLYVNSTAEGENERCNGTRVGSVSVSSSSSVIPSNSSSSSPGIDTFKDARDGIFYKWVEIGEQTWMAENLKYNTTTGSKCYKDLPSNCTTYGRLYDWATAMNLSSSCNTTNCVVNSGHQGLCPAGWHLPSSAEWNTLITYAGGSSAMKKLRATSGWGDSYTNLNGTDDYGFKALPGGFYSLG